MLNATATKQRTKSSLDLDYLRRLLEDGGLRVLDLRMATERARPDGSADVIIAPNDVEIVQAVKRCRALERETPVILIVGSKALDEEIVVGRHRLRPMLNALYVDNRYVRLLKIEADILATLMSHVGEAVSFELLSQILQRPYGSSRGSIAVHVCNLRRKFEDEPNQPRHLVTIRGRGYCFQP